MTHDTNAVAHDANEREQWEMLWHMMLETRGMKGNKVAHDANEGRQQS